MIAYLLGQYCSSFKNKWTAVLRSNPEIGHSVLPFQLKELIGRPLRTIGGSFPSCVIVINALDGRQYHIYCLDLPLDSLVRTLLADISGH